MKPIITSLMEADFYKFTMAQVAWKRFPDAQVRYGFKNRTKGVLLADVVPVEQLREELDHVRTLRFTFEEIEFLRTCPRLPPGLFSDGYLAFLAGLQLPEYSVEKEDGQYRIEVAGKWPEAIFWETLILNVVNELYFREVRRIHDRLDNSDRADVLWREGSSRLQAKIARLKALPDARVMEFGNRRRFSATWQETVLNYLMDEIPTHLIGTSNVRLAMAYGLRPSGTFAHEMYMVYSGLFRSSDEELRSSHNLVLRHWWEEYGAALSVALTDTYGSDFFFRDLSPEQARDWKWLRHDSGDPIAFGERAIAFYEGLGIDAKEKGIVYSDGLDIDVIERLHARFYGRINLTYGWGTNLTNDLGYKALSLVMKAIEANGNALVKLSDNPEKATGPADLVERFIRVFGHVPGAAEECTY